MDLAKASPHTIATFIVSGRLQLEEVPLKKRNQVAMQVKIIEQEKVVLDVSVTASSTKTEIIKALNVKGTKFPSSATKANLLALLYQQGDSDATGI